MNDRQQCELIQRYFLGTISEDDVAELDRRLAGDETLRAEFSAAARLDSNLRDAAASVAPVELDFGSATRSPKHLIAFVASAAAILILASILFHNHRRSSPSHAPIASISKASGPMLWIGDGGEVDEGLQDGDLLTGGTLEIHSIHSWAELVFSDGTSVWASGPAVLTISDGEAGKVIRVREGNLSLDVRPQPSSRPLRLVTPSAEAVVLGTQFNVSADSSSTSLTVNEGRVRVTRLADGSVQEVPADHRVIAALEQGSEFEALPRGDSKHEWETEFPTDIRQGQWIPDTHSSSGSLRAKAHLFRGDHGDRIDPILLHSAVVGPTGDPVILSEGARLRISGRLERSYRVSIGFGTHYPRGGFAGKYSLARTIEVEPSTGGRFQLDFDLEDFQVKSDRFPGSAAGHELVWFWIQTLEQDVGLEISNIELLVAK